MRNLKRVLALAMALVMTLGMMVIGANAASYPDADQIDAKYSEAVDVLTGIGVFRGMETGAFAPKEILNRAQASTLVYRVLTGDVTDAKKDLYDYSSFDDVKEGEWYTGYVTYAANGGYVKGYGDGNFGPYDQVTGVQVLAIMLRAIGYGQKGEFEGAAWKDNTLTYAQDLGLLNGIANISNLDKPASRELVAQLLFNAITKPEVVTYTPALGYNELPAYDDNRTLGQKTFGLEKIVGVIDAVGRKAGTTTLIDVSTSANGTLLNPVTVTGTNTPWTDIGYKASVWTVATTGVKTREAVSGVTIIGKSVAVNTAATTTKTIVPLVEGDKKIATLDTKEGYRVYFNGDRLTKYYNGDTVPTTGYWFDASDLKLMNGRNEVEIVNGLKVDFIDNDNGGLAEVIVFTEYTAGQVIGIANESNTGANAIVRDNYYFDVWSKADTTANIEVKAANVVSDTTLDVGDVVTYVQYADDTYVTVAPITTGSFTQINYNLVGGAGRTETGYVIGGETYVKANNEDTEINYVQDYFYGNDAVLSQTNARNKVSLDVYTDPCGYMFYVTETALPQDLLFVIWNEDTDERPGTTGITAAYPDGSVVDLDISKVKDAFGVLTTSFDRNKIDQDIYNNISGVLNYACSGHYVGDYTTGDINLQGGYLTTSSVVVDLRNVIARRATEGTVYTGRDAVPSLNDAVFHYVTDANGFITLAYITEGTPTDSKSFVVYHTDVNTYDRTGYSLSVIQGGSIETITLTQNQYNDIVALGVGLYEYKADGTLKQYTAFNEGWYNVTWSTNTLVLNDVNTGAVVDAIGYNDSKVNFWTLKIGNNNGTTGAAYDYSMVYGQDAKAYVVYKNGTASDIYIIAGSLVDHTGAVTPATAADNNTTPAAYTKAITLNGVQGKYEYYKLNGYITRSVFVADPTYTVTVNGQPSAWTNIPTGTKITLPKTDGNTAVATEYVQIENTTAGTTTYALAGQENYAVTGNLAITTGYYKYTVDGDPFYTTAGGKTFADLVSGTPAGTGSLWTFDIYTDEYVANSSAMIDISAYPSVAIKTGYVLVDATAVAAGTIITVNGVEVTDLSAAFPVSVADHVIVTDSTGAVTAEYGPTTSQQITDDITLP